MLYEIEIKGKVPSKKNSKRIVRPKGGKPILISSQRHNEWHTHASMQLNSQWHSPTVTLCDIDMQFYVPDYRQRDVTNMAESVMDLLVDCGVLEDDNWKVVQSQHYPPVVVDKTNPRVLIRISSYD